MLLAVTAGNPLEKIKHCQWNVHNPTTSGLLHPARLKCLALKWISLIPLLFIHSARPLLVNCACVSQGRKVNLKRNILHLIGLCHQMFFFSYVF